MGVKGKVLTFDSTVYPGVTVLKVELWGEDPDDPDWQVGKVLENNNDNGLKRNTVVRFKIDAENEEVILEEYNV